MNVITNTLGELKLTFKAVLVLLRPFCVCVNQVSKKIVFTFILLNF